MPQQEFKDKNGVAIKEGDVLAIKVFARWREYPGRKRVAVNGHSLRDVIVSDEGNLKGPHEFFLLYDVKYYGACMIIERCDDEQLYGAETTDELGDRVTCEAFKYMNDVFDSEKYTIISERGK